MNERIVIAGAGIGGLVAALALLQRGLSVSVLEQAAEFRPVGAGVQISPNGTRILHALGLNDQLSTVAVQPDGKELRLWNTGKTWPLFDLGQRSVSEYGFPYLMIHRGDLHAILVEAVRRADPQAIVMGASATGVSQTPDSVTLHLKNGRSIEGAVLIGADGVHSATRGALFGNAKARFTGCMAWRGVVPAERLPAHLARPVGVNWVGPGRHVITYPLRAGKLVNFVGVVERADWTDESWTAQGSLEECRADFAGWHADVHALIDNIDTHYRWALVSREPMEQWSKGRAVLLGDACHPMLPFMAQGAVMAIEDGMALARCLAEAGSANPVAAFARYEAERIARANRCVRAADRNRDLFHDARLSEPEDAKRYIDAEWNEGKVIDRYDWLFSHDGTRSPMLKGV